jgi:glycosyltransferase involved in cell wall biosynthesis
MRRILIINHTGQIGGAELGLLDLAAHYRERCHVLLFQDGPLTARLDALGVSWTILAAGQGMTGVRREAGRLRALGAVPSLAWQALRMLPIARRYDVLYPNSQKAAVVTMLIARLTGRPVVWHMHDILSPEHFAPLQRRLVTWLANRAARRVIVVSEAARQSFVDSGGDPDRAVVVYNGVDASHFARDSDATALRRSLGIGDAPAVGLFGRLTPWKGQHVLIRALAELPGVQAVIVGDALFGETGYRDELVALAASLGVAGRVHWLGHRPDVPALMAAVDLVVHTSTAGEPFGRVIVEGMLAGRPVLASDHGASRELLGEDTLALVPPDDPQALAGAVRRMLALPGSERAAIGARNRARAQAMFSLGAMIGAIAREVALEEAA